MEHIWVEGKLNYLVAKAPMLFHPTRYFSKIFLTTLAIRHFSLILHNSPMANPLIAYDSSIRTNDGGG